MSKDNKSPLHPVDVEIAKFRVLQEEIQRLRADQQVLMSQKNENDMVNQEFEEVESGMQVYKMIGTIMVKSKLEDAKQTVSQRLEMINGELEKVKKNTEKKANEASALATKIQEMQNKMQASAADGAKAVLQKAGQG